MFSQRAKEINYSSKRARHSVSAANKRNGRLRCPAASKLPGDTVDAFILLGQDDFHRIAGQVEGRLPGCHSIDASAYDRVTKVNGDRNSRTPAKTPEVYYAGSQATFIHLQLASKI